jgi:hypothetical protein
MEERDQHIDAFFAGLGDYTETPPAEVWAKLKQRLDKPRKRYAIWWLCLVAGVAGSAVLYTNMANPANEITTTANSSNAVSNVDPNIASPQTITTEPAPSHSIKALSSVSTPAASRPPVAKQTRNHTPTPPVAETVEENGNKMITAQVMQETPSIPVPDESTTTTPAKAEPPKASPTRQPEKDYLTLMPVAGKKQQPVVERADPEQYMALLPQAGKPVIKTQTIEQPQAKPVAIPEPQAHATEPLPPAEQKIAAKPIDLKKATTESKLVTTPSVVQDSVARKTKNRWEAGMRLGYEGGTRPFSTSAFTIAPYIQYAINSRLSLMTQPTFKYTWIQKYIISNDNYYRIIDSSRKEVQPSSFSPSGFLPRFAYEERYDSIIATQYVTNNGFFSADLPLMLSYRLKPRLSVYGGVNLNFTKIGIVTDEKWHNITRKDTLDAIISPKPIIGNASVNFDTLSVAQVYQHGSRPYSEYNSAITHGGTASPFRLGVTFGISYAYKERLLFDIRYRQNVTGLSAVPNVVIRRLYSQPYFNLSVGYRIFK